MRITPGFGKWTGRKTLVPVTPTRRSSAPALVELVPEAQTGERILLRPDSVPDMVRFMELVLEAGFGCRPCSQTTEEDLGALRALHKKLGRYIAMSEPAEG